MAIILGKKIGLENIIGGGNSSTPPEAWTYLAHKVDGGTWEWTWTAPKSGWYSIHIVGDGGSGGDGGSWERSYSGGGGGGGGHGAYALHQVYLKKGQTATFTRSGSSIVATIGDAVVTVTHGTNGRRASGDSGNSGGQGGTSSGANTLNLNGEAGGWGESGARDGYVGDTYVKASGGSGGRAGTIPSQKYSSGKDSAYKNNAPEFDLGNAGSGGGGGYLIKPGVGGTDIAPTTAPARSGRTGYTGGIVIDCAAS